MAERYLRQGPLASLHLQARALERSGGAITLCERPMCGQLALRGDVGGRGFSNAVKRALGFALPEQANTAAGGNDGLALWLGPDEWLLVVADGAQGDLAAKLRAGLKGKHYALSDVSDSRVRIGLAGTPARRVLAKGCSLDLHPREFEPGCCAQSNLARCHVLLHQLDDAPSYDVYVHRSFARYAWTWLEDAAREYGVSIAV